MISFLSKYVGKQYMSNTNVESSVLASYLVNDLGLNYNFSIPGFSQDSEFKLLVNNLLNQKYADSELTVKEKIIEQSGLIGEKIEISAFERTFLIFSSIFILVHAPRMRG